MVHICQLQEPLCEVEEDVKKRSHWRSALLGLITKHWELWNFEVLFQIIH